MNYVPNQNRKVHAETLAGFNTDDVKKTLLKNDPPYFAISSKISPYSIVTL